jgi:hypothetical protein
MDARINSAHDDIDMIAIIVNLSQSFASEMSGASGRFMPTM